MGYLSQATIHRVRIKFFRWMIFVNLEVLGIDYVPLNFIFHSTLWKHTIEKNGTGFNKSF